MSSFTPQEIEEFLQEYFDVVGARQYTGARYVPIFGRKGEASAEWDDSAPYEPLTVVLYLGNSYTSRRYVPAGINILDTDYWAATGTYNAQVQHAVDMMSDGLRAVQEEIAGVTEQMGGMETRLRDELVPFPTLPLSKYGTTGQVLSTLADGMTEWVNPVVPDATVVGEAVADWLDDHPEATTTVLDNSVSDAKLVQTGQTLEEVRATGRITAPLEEGRFDLTGADVAATANQEVRTDFIPVTVGTVFRFIARFTSMPYQQGRIVGFDADRTNGVVIANVDGGVTTNVYDMQAVIPSGTAYVRLWFRTNGSSYDYSAYRFAPINDSYPSMLADVGTLKATVAGLIESLDVGYQYLDTSAWDTGHYYNVSSSTGKIVKNSVDNRSTLLIENMPAGTYHYNRFAELAFTFVVNRATDEIATAADAGFVATDNGTVTIAYDFDLYITQLNTSLTGCMIANNDLPSAYAYGWYSLQAAYYVNPQGQHIYVVGTGNFSSIQAACDFATDDDIIYVRCGTYTEQVAIWNKKLHIIGEDKANTILIDHSGNYDTPPLEMSLGTLSHMTVIEDGSSPTGDPSSSKYLMAYCIHIEWQPPQAGEVLWVDDCEFVNHIHSPLGCGLYQDYTVKFTNCAFRCLSEESGNTERGSFYFHSNINPGITGQRIIAENCVISSNTARWAVLAGVPAGADNDGEAEARFSNCCIWNDNAGVADSVVFFDQSGGADVLEIAHSYGNTVSVLNN